MFRKIKDFFIELKTKDKCFEEHNKDGVCNGLVGGDSWSDYLCYSCMDCPHLTWIIRKNK
jgi:hypothetical protein